MDIPSIGTEISFTLDGVTRRGWVVAQEPAEIGCYPLQGDTTETLQWPLQDVQVLDGAEAPDGWEAVTLMNESDQPWIDLRLTTLFMERLRSDAQQAGIEPAEMFATYLQNGIQQMRD